MVAGAPRILVDTPEDGTKSTVTMSSVRQYEEPGKSLECWPRWCRDAVDKFGVHPVVMHSFLFSEINDFTKQRVGLLHRDSCIVRFYMQSIECSNVVFRSSSCGLSMTQIMARRHSGSLGPNVKTKSQLGKIESEYNACQNGSRAMLTAAARITAARRLGFKLTSGHRRDHGVSTSRSPEVRAGERKQWQSRPNEMRR